MPVSPVKFHSGFENDVSPFGWDGVIESPVAADVSVSTLRPHHGKSNLDVYLPANVAAATGFAAVYKSVSDTSYFARLMNVVFTATPLVSSRVIAFLLDTFGNGVVYFGMDVSGAARFYIRYRNAGAFANAFGPAVAYNTPYCIEGQHVKSTVGNADGAERLWVDGNLAVEVTGIDNDDRAVAYVECGLINSDSPVATAVRVLADCFVLSSMRIGCEKFRMNLRGRGGEQMRRSNLFSTVRSGTRMGLH